MNNVIRPLTAKEKEDTIEITGPKKSKLELDRIEKEWIKKNKAEIEGDDEEAKIACIRCHKLKYKSGLVHTDDWKDYLRMEFRRKRKIVDRYRHQGRRYEELLGFDYDFECPVCLAKATLFIETNDDGRLNNG